MELASGSANKRRLVFIGCLISAALLIEQAAWIWHANADIDAQDLKSIERGAHLVPSNAEAWDRLGRFRQWNFADPDPAAAVRDYERAVRDLPQSPYYWMDLATAYEQTGRVSEADAAFQRAVTNYPVSGEVAWQYGNFLLRENQVQKGLEEVHRAVAADPLLIPLAISRVWVSTRDVDVLLDRVVPPNPHAYFQALDFFQAANDADASLAVWNKLLGLNQPFEFRDTFPLLDELIASGRATDAEKVWLEAIHACGIPYEPQLDSSLIWNGRFTQPFANGGLGWRWGAPVGVAINFDDARVAGPARSVRLDFGGGNNTDLESPFQYVPVRPNSSYQFRGYLKTEAVTTESGIRFEISDPSHTGVVEVTTQNLTGTHPWTEAEADVVTGPNTHFLVVKLFRPPSSLFENKLSGTAWIADVSLTPSGHQEPAAP